MTRFAVFTYGHGDTVFTTRFRFVARVAVRFVKTLDFLPDPLPEGMERGTAAAAGLCGCTPIPLEPTPADFEEVTKTPTGWACTCGEANCAHILPWASMEDHDEDDGVGEAPRDTTYELADYLSESDLYQCRWGNAKSDTCPDCGHDYYHDAQGRCMYPMDAGDEARVCGWHPDVMGPVPCESRVES